MEIRLEVKLVNKYEFMITKFCSTKDKRLLQQIRKELKKDGFSGSEAWSRVMFDNPQLFDMITVGDIREMDDFHIEF